MDKAPDAVSAYTQVKIGGCSKIARNSQFGMSRCLDTSSTTQMTEFMGQNWRSRGTSRTKLVRWSISWIAVGETIWTSFIGTSMGENSERGVYVRSLETGFSVGICGWLKKCLERSRTWLPCGGNWWKNEGLANLHHFLTTCTWDALGVNANRMKQPKNSTRGCLSHVFLLEQQKNCWGGRNLTHKQKRGPATWKDAQKCVERYCDVANKKVEQLYKVSHPCLDDHQFKQEELESVGELSEVCSQIVLKCLYLARIGRRDISWSVNKLARWSVTKWTQACDERLARLTSSIFITQMTIVNVVMWETQHNTADLCYLKTQTLQATLRTQSQAQEVSCVFLEVELLSQSVGCARDKHRFRTVLQNLKLFLGRWTTYGWVTCSRSLGQLWLRFYEQPRTIVNPITLAPGNWRQTNRIILAPGNCQQFNLTGEFAIPKPRLNMPLENKLLIS